MKRWRRDWEDAVVLPSLRGREQVGDEARHRSGGGEMPRVKEEGVSLKERR